MAAKHQIRTNRKNTQESTGSKHQKSRPLPDPDHGSRAFFPTSRFLHSTFRILNSTPRPCLPYPTCPFLRAFAARISALQVSSPLYKSPLYAQNKPNLQNPRNNATPFTTKDYKEKPPLPEQKKQTQSNPTVSPRSQSKTGFPRTRIHGFFLPNQLSLREIRVRASNCLVAHYNIVVLP